MERRYKRGMENHLRDSEMGVIANSQLDEEALTTLNQRIGSWITAGGGTVANTNVWGRRTLMYMINKQTAGIYVQFNFQLDPAASRELDRSLRIDEQVIRHMIIRLDEE